MRLLREACTARGIEYREIDARSFLYDDDDQLAPGDLLYRPATSLAAMRVEQFLFGPGVATFYRDPLGAFFTPASSPLLFQRAGLPIPRTYFCHSADRRFLDACAERVGGFPLVVKMLGYSRGVGVMRVDSLPSLYSVVDFAVAQGGAPLITAYVDASTHWRVNVVGARAVAAYRNAIEANDFRTYARLDPADYTADVRPDLAELAIASIDALRLETGGVDILEHPSGRLYLLESNFPCYFGTAQEVIGVNIAGAMVDHLVAKALRLAVSAAP